MRTYRWIYDCTRKVNTMSEEQKGHLTTMPLLLPPMATNCSPLLFSRIKTTTAYKWHILLSHEYRQSLGRDNKSKKCKYKVLVKTEKRHKNLRSQLNEVLVLCVCISLCTDVAHIKQQFCRSSVYHTVSNHYSYTD